MRSFRTVWAACALTAFVVGGCKCKPDNTGTPTVTITFPTDGASLGPSDDVDPDRAGLQIDVTAATTNVGDGSSASLVVNRDNDLTRETFVEAQTATFESVTLTAGDAEGTVVLTVSARDRDTGRVPRDEITITVQTDTGLDCAFTSPLDGAVLAETDDVDPGARGLQYDVTLQCSTDLTGTPASLVIDGRAVPSAVFAGEVVTFAGVTLGEGSRTLTAEVVSDTTSWTGSVSVTVDTPECEVRLEPPGSFIANLTGDPPRLAGKPVADANGDPADGVQVAFSASTPDCQGGTAVLYVDAAEVASVPVDATTVDFGDISLADGTRVVYVEVTSASPDGPTGFDAERSIFVDGVAPAPVLDFPTGAVIGIDTDADGDPTNGFQFPVELTIPALEATDDAGAPEKGALIAVELTADTGTVVTAACVLGVDNCAGALTDTYVFALDADLGLWTLTVDITDPAGNTAAIGPMSVEVIEGASTLSVTSPIAGAVVAAPAQGVTDLIVEVQAPDANAGAAVTVVCDGVGSANATLDSAGKATVTLDAASTPCDGLDTSCLATMVVDGTPVSSRSVAFRLDVHPPGVAITEPGDGDTLFDTNVVAGIVTTCLEDGQSVTIENGDGQTASGPVSGNAALVPISLASGPHTLIARANDVAGNQGVSASVAFSIDADPPKVVFVRPSDGLLLAAADDEDAAAGFQYDVQIQVANKPAGTEVLLEVGYDDGGATVWRAPIGPIATASGSLRATFGLTELPEGDFMLRATATGPSGLQGQSVISVTINTGGVACNIVDPVNGTSFGATADSDSDTANGIQHDVRVRTGASDGKDVVLTLTDGEGTSTLTTVQASGGEAVFPAQTFLTASGAVTGDNFVDVECDPAGSATGALQSRVRVDLEAPVASIVSPADGATLNLAAADASAQAGFQANFVAVAADVSGGASVSPGATGELTVDCDDGTNFTLPVTFQAYGSGVEARARPTLPDEASCTLSFVAIDAAGNVSAPATASILVDRVAPTLTLTGPVDGRRFNAGDDVSGETGFQGEVRVVFSGADTLDVLISNDFGDDGTAGWVNQPSGSYTPTATETKHTFPKVTFTLGSEDLVNINVHATDAAGNVTEATAAVIVDLVAPVVAIVRPDPGALPSCFVIADDEDRTTSGFQTQIDVSTVGVEDGLPLRLCSTADPGSGLGACKQDTAAFVVGESSVSSNLAVFRPATLADGTQSIYVEVEDAAGNFNASNPFAICVDTVQPDVTSFTVDSDTTLPAGTINAVEYVNAGDQVCVTVAVTGAEGQTLTVETNNPAGGTLGSATVTSGQAQVCGPLADGGHTLVAKVKDDHGNPNRSPASPQIDDPGSEITLLVDRIAPTLTITQPSGSTLNASDDQNAATPILDLDFSVSSDAGDGQTVTFLVDGSSVGTAVLAGGTATLASHPPLSDGSHDLRVQVTDVAGNPTTTSRTVNVDTAAPSVTISSPTDGTTFSTPTVDVVVLVVGGTAGDPLVITDGVGGTVLANTTVAGAQPQTVTLSLGDATYALVASATDGAGNVGSSSVVGITVDTIGCNIQWTDPAGPVVQFLASDDESATAGLQTTVTANTTDCAGRDIALEVAGSTVQTVTSDGSGNASFTLDLADGAAGVKVRAIIDDGSGNTTTDSFTASVDVTPPTYTRVSPTGTAFTYVAATNRYLAAGTFNGTTVVADRIAGGNADVRYTVTVGGALGGTLSATLGATAVGTPVTVSADPQTIDFDLTLAQNASGTLTLGLTDAAGNLVTDAFPVTVDVIAPQAPIFTIQLLNERTASLDAGWTDTGDDGVTGTATAYDVRWDDADITTEAQFDAARSVTIGINPTTPSTPRSTTLVVPPLNTYFMVLRIEDEVGNRSPLTLAGGGGVSATEQNWWTTDTLTGEGGFFGWHLEAAGDLNNDGKDDFVVTAPTLAVGGKNAAGAAYVYYGGQAYAAMDANRQRLGGTLAGGLFGFHVAAGDVSGDGIPDLVIGENGYSANRGRAWLYLGTDHSATDCSTMSNCFIDSNADAELRGLTGVAGEFGRGVAVIGDINGDGVGEVVVSARKEQGARGRVYIYTGRNAAAWSSAATGDDGDGVKYVPVSGMHITGTAVDDQLGDRWGFADLGDLDGDGAAEFVVPASTITTTYAFDGLGVSGAGTITATDNNLTGSPLVGFASSDPGMGLGLAAIVGDVRRGGGVDLILGNGDQGVQGRIYVYPASSSGLGASILTLRAEVAEVAATNLGHDLAVGDLDKDGAVDLVAGTNGTNAKRAFVWYNTLTTPEFNQFPDSRLLSTDSGYGVAVDIGDYNGDASDDLLIAAPFAGTGSVVIYH